MSCKNSTCLLKNDNRVNFLNIRRLHQGNGFGLTPSKNPWTNWIFRSILFCRAALSFLSQMLVAERGFTNGFDIWRKKFSSLSFFRGSTAKKVQNHFLGKKVLIRISRIHSIQFYQYKNSIYLSKNSIFIKKLENYPL